MTVEQLICKLTGMPPTASVGLIWDGGVGSFAECVWLSRDGTVCISDFDEPVYLEHHQPADAVGGSRWQSQARPDGGPA